MPPRTPTPPSPPAHACLRALVLRRAVLLRLTGWLPEVVPISPTLPAAAQAIPDTGGFSDARDTLVGMHLNDRVNGCALFPKAACKGLGSRNGDRNSFNRGDFHRRIFTYREVPTLRAGISSVRSMRMPVFSCNHDFSGTSSSSGSWNPITEVQSPSNWRRMGSQRASSS